MSFTSAEMAVGILLKELRRCDKYSGFTALNVDDKGKPVLLIVSEHEGINGRLLEMIKSCMGDTE